MDREHVKGYADKAKGIKEGAGKISGDREMQHEGKADKAKGDVHKAAGDMKDAARNTARSLPRIRGQAFHTEIRSELPDGGDLWIEDGHREGAADAH